MASYVSEQTCKQRASEKFRLQKKSISDTEAQDTESNPDINRWPGQPARAAHRLVAGYLNTAKADLGQFQATDVQRGNGDRYETRQRARQTVILNLRKWDGIEENGEDVNHIHLR